MAVPGQWRYTVNIPLWITGKDAEGESVVVSGVCGAAARAARRAQTHTAAAS